MRTYSQNDFQSLKSKIEECLTENIESISKNIKKYITLENNYKK